MRLLIVLLELSSFCLTIQGLYRTFCRHEVYCNTDLLHVVQNAGLFNDSKTLVDMRLKKDPANVIKSFKKLQRNGFEQKEIKKFVNDNFEDFNEFEITTPVDFVPEPKFLSKIEDNNVKQFARNLVQLWVNLTRRIKPEVRRQPNRYSLIPVNNPFIIPGGRFREIYYWDTYWIIKGLLISGMTETARQMLDNFVQLIKNFGFIPNGTRQYYLDRSQPPLFTAMAKLYYDKTKNGTWLRENIDYFKIEIEFWLNNRAVNVTKNGKTYKMFHYSSHEKTPRPESFKEDYNTASKSPNTSEDLFLNIRSGAESGWDFSSRWLFDKSGTNNATLADIQTTRVIPVDLNAFLCNAFDILRELYQRIGYHEDIVKDFYVKYKECLEAVKNVLYDEIDGVWYDYDMKLEKSRKYFYVSNLTPLWTKTYDEEKAKYHGEKALKYLGKNGILTYPGGIPTSVYNSGQQWDLPNAWPPLQSILVFGLLKTEHPYAIKHAKIIAQKWVDMNMNVFQQEINSKNHSMFEKYNANIFGGVGGGGEYEVQTGFGWSNGVALEFIEELYVSMKHMRLPLRKLLKKPL